MSQFRPAILHVCNPQPPACPQYWFTPDCGLARTAGMLDGREIRKAHSLTKMPGDLQDHLKACLELDPVKTAALLEYIHWHGRSTQQACPEILERHS